MLVADIATEGQQSLADDAHTRTTVTSGRVDSPAFSTGCQLDPRRRERGIRNCLLARFVAFALDPITVALEKMFDGTW
jgi:hypothetical protein